MSLFSNPFRRRAASASRSDSDLQAQPSAKGKAGNSTNGQPFVTPKLPSMGNSENQQPQQQHQLNNGNGNMFKRRTPSGLSLTSSASSTMLTTSPVLGISRREEKEQLETLNNRLAVIIDTVRGLEQENSRLLAIVKSTTDVHEVETTKVKALYERELDDAKKLIEELAHERSRLEIELEKARSETSDVFNKATRNERDIQALAAQVRKYESELASMRTRADASALDAARNNDENVVLRKLNSDLEKQVSSLKRQLECETLLRVDLENKNKTLAEELVFKEEVFHTQVNEIKSQYRASVHPETELRQEYDNRLVNELQAIRMQTDDELSKLRDELANQYEQKIEELKVMLHRNNEQAFQHRQDMQAYRMRIEELTKARDELTDKMIVLEKRNNDLEDRNLQSHARQDESLSERDIEIHHLKQIIDQMQMEYQSLLDAKVGLDREISTYRKLLDSEELRLNIPTRLNHSPSLMSNGSNGGGMQQHSGSATPTIGATAAITIDGPAASASTSSNNHEAPQTSASGAAQQQTQTSFPTRGRNKRPRYTEDDGENINGQAQNGDHH